MSTDPMEMTDTVLLEYPSSYGETVAVITINRPKAYNALNSEIIGELRKKLSGIGNTPHLCLMRGAGGKAFVAGADIKEMQQASREELVEFIEAGQALMRQIENVSYPVVAVVEGLALGGGLELALACDFIVATKSASFGTPEINLGLLPGFGGTQRLCARLSVARAKHFVLTGESCLAEDAFSMGLCDYLCDAEQLETMLEKISATFSSKSREALAAGKRAVESYYLQGKDNGLQREVEAFLEIVQTSNAQEGLSAFLEKRKPDFK